MQLRRVSLRNNLKRSASRLIGSEETAVVEFDGAEDCFSLAGQRLEYKTLTVFMVNHRGRNDYTSGITIDPRSPSSRSSQQVVQIDVSKRP